MRSKIALATLIALTTVLFAAIFLIGQQTIRLSANMPQIQTAQDVALQLENGSSPSAAIPAVAKKVDLATSSAGFVIIYDKLGNPLASTGELHGATPIIPYGVLQHTKDTGYNAVTWQPASNVRVASVEVKARSGYYVLAGRSLAEPEKLIETIGRLTLFGYAVSLLTLFAGWFVFTKAKN